MKFVSLCCMLSLGMISVASNGESRAQREDPSRVARRLLSSLVKGDSDTIFKYLRPADIDKLHLTKAKVKRVMDELVFPTTMKIRPQGSSFINKDAIPLTASVILRAIGPHKTKVLIAVTTYPERPGPRATFKNFMEIAWLLQAAYAKRAFPVGIASNEALLNGLKRDRPKLEALGVRSFLEDTPSAGVETFETMQKSLESSIRIARKLKNLRRVQS